MLLFTGKNLCSGEQKFFPLRVAPERTEVNISVSVIYHRSAGPSCSKVMTSLVNVTLKFQTYIHTCI